MHYDEEQQRRAAEDLYAALKRFKDTELAARNLGLQVQIEYVPEFPTSGSLCLFARVCKHYEDQTA